MKFLYNKGSITVEATIVVSTVILILMMLIYSFFIMYQKTLLTKAATSAAQQGAEIWTDSRKSIGNGSMKVRNMEFTENYYNLTDFFINPYIENIDINNTIKVSKELNKTNLQDAKVIQMRDEIKKELARGILKPTTTTLQIDFNNIIVQRQLTVTLKQEIKLPFGGIKEIFDGKETMTLEATGIAIVAEPAEYIRNVDLGLEYASELKEDLITKVEELKKMFGK